MNKHFWCVSDENATDNYKTETFKNSLKEFNDWISFGYISINEFIEENKKIITVKFNEPMGLSEKKRFLLKIYDSEWHQEFKKPSIETVEKQNNNSNGFFDIEFSLDYVMKNQVIVDKLNNIYMKMFY